jgi:cellulose synthase operon protein C
MSLCRLPPILHRDMPNKLLCWLSLSVFLAVASVATAKEAAHQFLEKLRVRGYGEVTLDYLDYLKQQNLVPADMTGDWDLYQARAWRLAIGEAFNAKEVAERREKAQGLLEKYLKEHPESALAAEEVSEWGTMGLKEGLKLADQAQASKDPDPARKTALNAEARTTLEAAKIKLTQAVDMGVKQLATVRAASPELPKRQRRSAMTAKQKAAAEAVEKAELFWLDAKFKLGKTDFYTAQTFADDATEEGKKRRAELLKQATKAFYDIYSGYRTTTAGLLAHTWEGKAQDALGDQDLAQEIYEEVLVLTPDTGRTKVDPAQENLFCEVKYFSLLITLKRGGPKVFLADAEPWLKDYKAWAANDGYQGIALETAKAYIAEAEAAPADQRIKLHRDAVLLLKGMQKVRSEYHSAAAVLLRSEQAAVGQATDVEPKNFDEATAQGDDAAGGLQWESAVKAYTKALEFIGKLPAGPKRQGLQTTIQDKLDTSRYNFACQLLATGKIAETIALAKELLPKLDQRGELAPRVAALWVRAALSSLATAADAPAKEAALTELAAATKTVIDSWPDKPEADDARIALGQASLVQGKPQDALAVFEQVNGRSLRYPLSLLVAAQTHLRLLDQEQKKPTPDPAAIAKELSTAQQQLEKSVDLQGQAGASDPAAAPQLLETRLLLAQVYLVAGEPAKASALLQPIVDTFKDAAPAQLDQTMIKAFSAAVRAYATTGKFAEAGAVANLLLERGQDDPQVNSVLVGFARTLQAEFKLANAQAIEAQASPDLAARMVAEPRLTQVKELSSSLLPRLADRKSNTPANLIFIGDLAMQVGLGELANTIYHRILDAAAADPAFAKLCGDAGVIRVRSQLIELLREKKEYAEGVKQADTLIEQVPKALEPLMAKGRLLQAWAETDPTKFPDAVAHWTSLRQKLEPMRKKPAEYYEVNYNVALCLFLESQKTGDKTKAVDAQKVLNALLITAPKLDGPDTVARYKKLVDDAQKLVGPSGQPAAEKLGASK